MKINIEKLRTFLEDNSIAECILSDISRATAVDFMIDYEDSDLDLEVCAYEILEAFEFVMNAEYEDLPARSEWLADCHKFEVFEYCGKTSVTEYEITNMAWRFAKHWLKENYHEEDFYYEHDSN